MQLTRKGLGKNILGSICQFLDWLDDSAAREELWPEVTGIWHRATRFEHVVDRETEWIDGDVWLVNGKIHRSGDRPAVISSSRQMWFKNGLLHRDNDLPSIVKQNGECSWSTNIKIKKEDQLAHHIYSNSRLEWYDTTNTENDGFLIDVLHKEHGPAVVLPGNTQEFWTNGVPIII